MHDLAQLEIDDAVAWVKRNVGWKLSVLIAILLVASCGAILSGGDDGDRGAASESYSSEPTEPVTPTADASRWPTPTRGSVLEAVLELEVQDENTSMKYSRGEFGKSWEDVDRNGCDQRNDVLRRDTVRRHTKPGTSGCVLQSGWVDDDSDWHYGRKIKYVRGEGEVEIDHVVSLADAWRSGAFALSREERLAFANDPMELQAVDSKTNRDKADHDASEWLPSDGWEKCAVIIRQVAIKKRFNLTVDAHEQTAMAETLLEESCDVLDVPGKSEFKIPKPKPIGEPKPKPTPKPEPDHDSDSGSDSGSSVGTVHPGSFCSPPGATGVANGNVYTCKGPGQPRWRR